MKWFIIERVLAFLSIIALIVVGNRWVPVIWSQNPLDAVLIALVLLQSASVTISYYLGLGGYNDISR